MNVRKLSTLFAILGLLTIVSACNDAPEEDVAPPTDDYVEAFGFPELDQTNLDGIIAEYDGGEVTGEEFGKYLAVQAFFNPSTPINDEEFRQGMVQELVMEKVFGELGEVDEFVQEQKELIWEQFEGTYGESGLQEAYTTLELTKEDIEEALVSLLLVESYFRNQVSEQELLDFYEEVLEELTTATFSHILISTDEMGVDGEMEEVRSEEEALEKANELYDQLMDGADINELAIEYSDDGGSAATGGRYEGSYIVELVPEFSNALMQQEIDEIGKPVRTDYGYHIIRVEEIEVMEFDEIKEALVSELVYEKYVEYYLETVPNLITEIHL